MAKKLSVESLTKKLKNVANTQDSIPMFSLWIIHHKPHHELIVNTWLEILKNSKPKHRLTLWYLANDVIQSCNRKKADVFKESFANALPEAIAFLRDKSILPGVERVLKVWSTRNVYDTEIIDQLHAALLTNRPPDKLRQKLLVEFKPGTLVDSITSFKKREDILQFEEKQLTNFHVDASSSDDIHKLKDKVGGEKFSRNFEESAMHIERFIQEYESYVEERRSLIETLSKGAVFYRAQYHEAKIVVNAYQSFDTRVQKMKRLVDSLKLKLSPPISPKTAEQGDVADMDMSDSDEELGSKPAMIVAVDTNILRPVQMQNSGGITTFTTSKPLMISTQSAAHQPSSVVNRPGMRGASSVSILSTMQDSIMKKETSDVNIPITFNGVVTPEYQPKHSLPSASPPSPTDSPELNIVSPPRHQSLESRLADIFSGSMKGDANADSESDNESLAPVNEPASQPKSAKEDGSHSQPTTQAGGNSTTPCSPNVEEPYPFYRTISSETSWQNTIPVIGGNRSGNSSQVGSVMGNLHLVVDGSSTPLQDETFSETENYMDINQKDMAGDVIDRQHTVSSLLPPPSFSGDALHFLTKFMGQKTNTVLVQPEVNDKPVPETWNASTASGARASGLKPGTVLDGSKINWNSVEEQIGGKEGISWLRECVSSAMGATSTGQEEGQEAQGLEDSTDTDYRMVRTGSRPVANKRHIPLIDGIYGKSSAIPNQGEINFFTKILKSEDENSVSNPDRHFKGSKVDIAVTKPAEQFMEILRKRSSERTPSCAPMSTVQINREDNSAESPGISGTDYIVEEEEIELDEDATEILTKNDISLQKPKPTTVESASTKEICDKPDVDSVLQHQREGRFTGNYPEHFTGPHGPQTLGNNGPRSANRFGHSFQIRPRPPNLSMTQGNRPPLKRPFYAPPRIRMEGFHVRGPVRRPVAPWNGKQNFAGANKAQQYMYLEEEYYDRLYEELQPDLRRGLTEEMNRMPY